MVKCRGRSNSSEVSEVIGHHRTSAELGQQSPELNCKDL